MARDIIGAYRSVCRDLAGLEAYRAVAYERLKASHSVVFKGKMPSSVMCYVPVDTALEYYDQAAEDFNETIDAINRLHGVKVQMEKLIASMSEPEQIVILLHVEQGLNLREIAETSHYSYGHLRNVAMKLRSQDMTESANAS